MATCFSLPDCFSVCKTTQELPLTHLARYVDLFHLVIADTRRPETLSLPHGLGPPIKHTSHFSQATALWTQEWQSCGLVPVNLSFLFHTWHGLYSVIPYSAHFFMCSLAIWTSSFEKVLFSSVAQFFIRLLISGEFSILSCLHILLISPLFDV
jgi:hypothetical protein